MPEKIAAGIIGTGFIGPAHVEAARRLGNVDILAVAEANQELAQQKADEPRGEASSQKKGSLNYSLSCSCLSSIDIVMEQEKVHLVAIEDETASGSRCCCSETHGLYRYGSLMRVGNDLCVSHAYTTPSEWYS